MNDDRRKTLQAIIDALNNAKADTEEIQGQEEESLENLPDSMKEGERGGKLQEAIDNLSGATDSIDSAIDQIQSAMS